MLEERQNSREILKESKKERLKVKSHLRGVGVFLKSLVSTWSAPNRCLSPVLLDRVLGAADEVDIFLPLDLVLTLLGTRITPAPNIHDIVMDLRADSQPFLILTIVKNHNNLIHYRAL